jgi:uncharacterized tellurite resistance protein B-like protein
MAFPDDVDKNAPTRLERCKVAFACSVARRITEADGVIDMGEVDLLMRVFSDELMQACGFLADDRALTAEFDVALMDAKRLLPKHLSLDDKLGLVTLFHATVMADGEATAMEESIMLQAANELRVPNETLQSHLSSLG